MKGSGIGERINGAVAESEQLHDSFEGCLLCLLLVAQGSCASQVGQVSACPVTNLATVARHSARGLAGCALSRALRSPGRKSRSIVTQLAVGWCDSGRGVYRRCAHPVPTAAETCLVKWLVVPLFELEQGTDRWAGGLRARRIRGSPTSAAAEQTTRFFSGVNGDGRCVSAACTTRPPPVLNAVGRIASGRGSQRSAAVDPRRVIALSGGQSSGPEARGPPAPTPAMDRAPLFVCVAATGAGSRYAVGDDVVAQDLGFQRVIQGELG